MSDQPLPSQPDPAVQLERDVYLQVVIDLRGALPPRIDDTPETRIRHDRVAVAQAAAMLPTNPNEAHLAAQAVVAGARGRRLHNGWARFACVDGKVLRGAAAENRGVPRSSVRHAAARRIPEYRTWRILVHRMWRVPVHRMLQWESAGVLHWESAGVLHWESAAAALRGFSATSPR